MYRSQLEPGTFGTTNVGAHGIHLPAKYLSGYMLYRRRNPLPLCVLAGALVYEREIVSQSETFSAELTVVHLVSSSALPQYHLAPMGAIANQLHACRLRNSTWISWMEFHRLFRQDLCTDGIRSPGAIMNKAEAARDGSPVSTWHSSLLGPKI